MDDIADTGHTLKSFENKHNVIVTLHYHEQSIVKPDFYCEEKNDKVVSLPYSNWIKKNQISQYSFPKANHKIFNFLNKHDWNL